MLGASRGVCVLHKESSHLRGPLLMKIKRDTGMRLFFLTSLCMYQTYPYGGIIRIRLWVEAFSLLSAG